MNELIKTIIELLKTGVEYSVYELTVYTDAPATLVMSALRNIELNHRLIINKFGVDWRYKLVDLKTPVSEIEADNTFPESTLRELSQMVNANNSVSAPEVMQKFGVELGYANRLLEHLCKTNSCFKKVVTVCNSAGINELRV